jgi:hypothetical protein
LDLLTLITLLDSWLAIKTTSVEFRNSVYMREQGVKTTPAYIVGRGPINDTATEQTTNNQTATAAPSDEPQAV